MNRLAVFDCDGTLVDSQFSICVAMETAFAELGLESPPRAAIRRVVGLSLGEAVGALAPLLGPAERDGLVERYKLGFRDLRARGVVQEPLFPGIAAAIAALSADGWLLGVATGKSQRVLTHCLERHGIAPYFVTLQTADHHPSKPHPAMLRQAMAEAGVDPASTAMIGDTSFDMAMAGAAGAMAIGVAWGYHGADELTAEGAEGVATSPDELPRLLQGVATAPFAR